MKESKEFDIQRDKQDVEAYQSVKSQEQMVQQDKGLTEEEIIKKRIKQGAYSCSDQLVEALWNDDAIYISVTNEQHQAIVDYSNGKTEHLGNLGLGFFTDEATVNVAMEGEALNNKLFNEMCQIAPYHEIDDEQQIDEFNYKPHVERLIIDRDQLEALYGRRELPVLVSRCLANDFNSSGGGHQGYCHLIDQLIEDRILVHVPEESYSRYDRKLLVDAQQVVLNDKVLVNSILKLSEYREWRLGADARGQDCEKGLKQYQEDLKYSHFKYNRTLKERYENIYDKTGKAYTLSEFAQMSKTTVPELSDADVKAVCEECRSQEVQMRNEIALER